MTYCVRCDSNNSADEDEDYCLACNDWVLPLPDPVKRGIFLLAKMTRNSPDYSVTVKPFADAHQEACQALDQMQKAGIDEAW